MTNGVSRRRTLACLGTGLAVGIAGCSGGGNGPTETAEPTDDQSGSSSSTTSESGAGGIQTSGESAVDGLEIVDLERQGGNSNKLLLITTVRNTGDENTDIFEYNYEMSVYDSAGNEVEGQTGTARSEDVAPGETGVIHVSYSVPGDLPEIARAEVSINCKGALTDGAYCQS